LPHLRETPAVVVLPDSASAVQRVVQLCSAEGVPFVARGHGTGLSGGALPVPGGVVISLARLNRVLDIDIPNKRVTVEPGVTNLEITRQVAPFGYYYAPDPSSQQVCSIGGNVAENSGGAHCLKYGFTVHHVLEVEAVLPNGELVRIGSSLPDGPGPDLLGLVIGAKARWQSSRKLPCGSSGSQRPCRRCWPPTTAPATPVPPYPKSSPQGLSPLPSR
jgi:glycolate oxidase